MTVDEYLNQIRTSRYKTKQLCDELMRAEVRAHDVRSPSNYGDGTPQTHGSENRHEIKLVEFVDMAKEFDESRALYEELRDTLELATDNMPCWAGNLIYHVYLYNVVFEEEDDLKGAGDIVRTNDRREILSKLAEAKLLLADALRAQCVSIE